MHDVAISLDHQPGNLATMGEVVGRAGLNLEGGGCFSADGRGIAHFLFDDGFAAQHALEAAGLEVTAVREVLFYRLNQGRPGALGQFCRMLAEAGINIEVMYSDHDHRLVLVVDDLQRGRILEEQWRQRNQISLKHGKGTGSLEGKRPTKFVTPGAKHIRNDGTAEP